MGDDDPISAGCLFGFGFSFGLLLAGVALVAVVGATLVVGYVVLAGVAGVGADLLLEDAPSDATPALPQLPPGHVETQTGIKGTITGRDGEYVDILLSDGNSTWVRIDSLTEESRQVVRDTFPD